MTTYIYNVNGTEFEDTTAFGKAWEQALATAKAEHCGIDRTVVRGSDIRYEFFAKGGVFLADRFRTVDKVAIF